jgi:hypothetical protein
LALLVPESAGAYQMHASMGYAGCNARGVRVFVCVRPVCLCVCVRRGCELG